VRADEEDTVGLLGFIIVGAIAGYLGRLLMPGRQPMGCIGTTLLGMAGSLVGGTLASLLFQGRIILSGAGIIGSILGVLIVLFVLDRTGRSPGRSPGRRRGRASGPSPR
jgi:uncharacterized membrane protein YeaQ/YmgE (transglycosylase-associated protein family)